MKILVTLDFPPAHGGIQRYLGDIVRHEYGSEDVVFVGGSAADGNDALFAPTGIVRVGKKMSRFHSKAPLAALFFRLLAALRQNPGAHVDAANVYAAIPVWTACRLFCRGYGVYTYAGELLALQKRGLKSRILKRVLVDAERLYVLGEFTQALLQRAGIDRPVMVTPPHIDVPSAAYAAGTRSGDCFTILSVARLVEHKGIDLLIDALAVLLKEGRKLRLHVAGDGPCRAALIDQSVRLGIAESVAFPGSLDEADLEAAYRASSCFVLCSRDSADAVEGFGIVLLEAMARGLPVVGTASGGIPAVLGNGAYGILVPPENPPALAAALRGLMDDPLAAGELARRGCEHVRVTYGR